MIYTPIIFTSTRLSSPLNSVIMGAESGAGSLTYHDVYWLDKAETVIYGVSTSQDGNSQEQISFNIDTPTVKGKSSFQQRVPATTLRKT